MPTVPWPHGFEAEIDHIDRVEVRELRAFHRGRTFVRGYDSAAVVRGLPERLAPGVADHARHSFLVQTLGRAIDARRKQPGTQQAT